MPKLRAWPLLSSDATIVNKRRDLAALCSERTGFISGPTSDQRGPLDLPSGRYSPGKAQTVSEARQKPKDPSRNENHRCHRAFVVFRLRLVE